MRPHRGQPTRLPRPWDSPGKNTGVGCHFLLQCRKVKSKSEVTQSCMALRPHELQEAPPSMRFSKQEYWSGLRLPSPIVNARRRQIWNLETSQLGCFQKPVHESADSWVLGISYSRHQMVSDKVSLSGKQFCLKNPSLISEICCQFYFSLYEVLNQWLVCLEPLMRLVMVL